MRQPALPGKNSSVFARMLRVLALKSSVYAEVECDPAGTRQAVVVVAVVAAGAALGMVLLSGWRPGAILGSVLAALIRWLLWSGLESLIGRVLFQRQLSLERHIRALGYAQTPQLLAILAFVPLVGAWVVVASRLLTLVAGTLALSVIFELHRRQVVAIRLVSFGISFAVAAGVQSLIGDAPFLTALLRP